MATIATPRKRVRFGRKWWIIGGVAVVLALIVGLFLTRGGANTSTATPPGWKTEAATTGTISATVSATGSVEAQAQADLRFATDGTVTEILVKPGDKVQANQPLA